MPFAAIVINKKLNLNENINKSIERNEFLFYNSLNKKNKKQKLIFGLNHF